MQMREINHWRGPFKSYHQEENMKKMKLSAKIGLGFGLLIFIALILGGMAVFNMKNAATESTKLAKEYVPEVDVAARIRGASNRIMYAMRGYGFTENEQYYNEALQELEAMNQAVAAGGALSKEARNLQKLDGQLTEIKKAKGEYQAAMEDTKRIVGELDALRAALDENAAKYMSASAEFLEGQNQAFKQDLAERQEKIRIVTELVEIGSTVRVTNFKAQATNDPVMMQEAINKLDGVTPLTEELRKITRDDEDIQRIDATVAAATKYQAAMKDFLQEFRKGMAADERLLSAARREMDTNAEIYVTSCDAFLAGQQEKLTRDMTERHAKMTLANDVIDLGNDTRIKAFKSQAMRDPALMIEGEKNFAEIEAKFDELRKVTYLKEDLARIDTVAAAAQGYRTAMNTFLAQWKELQALGKTRDGLGNTLIDACVLLADAGMDATTQIATDAMHSLNRSSYVMIVGLIAALLAGVALAITITRSITRPINRIIEGLNEGADQVASASGQVSAASQSLAEGASEQAASIEETSSSLEEMSSMTKQNAEHAGQANTLMEESKETVGSANASMTEMVTSMQEITKASEETSKIIKTIDEIAFQTNLLALNAAVEAARAGEAGAGFAVVADEVRNLALRAAEAARNTSDLIEGTTKKVQDGSTLVERTSEEFGKVEQSAMKVAELIGEIAAASREQSEGIDQVNLAVNDMDKVTQQNAANAEESASSSEEMNAQAEQMKLMVDDLVTLVGGATRHHRGKKPDTVPQRDHSTKSLTHGHNEHQAAMTPAKQSGREVNPEKTIPFDDDESFQDF